MYFPYLRGRQFELIALREYALQRGDNNNIIPIIEPVKSTFNSMKLALPKLIDGNVKFALILNPQDGDFKKTNEKKDIVDELKDELKDLSKWIPAYRLNNNYKEVISQVEKYSYENVMLICTESTNTDDIDFTSLSSMGNVKYFVSKENRTLKRKIRGKNFILLNDNFKAQKRNSDYLAMPESKFSEEHLFFREDGYKGFSDYTTLVSDFIEGGAAPYAVAIHLTYKKENEEIWIRHFASNSNDDKSNIQGKFAEAAEKAVKFLDSKSIHTIASEELRSYFNNGDYPGLGMVKKISIKNHFELMNDSLKIIG